MAALENENARLRDREQALMDAVSAYQTVIFCTLPLLLKFDFFCLYAQIEELSNQNEDLIDKLKESMERELVLR